MATEIAAKQLDGYVSTRFHAWRAFVILFLLMMVDFIDRQIVVAMFPYLKAEWNLSDTQLGGLVAVVSITVSLGALPIALLVDRWHRVKSIALMAGIWSVATLACAFSGNFAQLMAVRAVIGIGEAGYAPAGSALLASIFPKRMRAAVIGSFFAAAVVGSLLGVAAGGILAANWGWRVAFAIVGIPGFILAGLLLLYVRDYATVRAPRPPSHGERERIAAQLTELLRSRSAMAAFLGGALQFLFVSSLYNWLPSYLNRYYGMAPDEAGLQTASFMLLAALGMVLWARVADVLSQKNPRFMLLIPALVSILTFSIFGIAFGLISAGSTQLILIAIGSFAAMGTMGPVNAMAIGVTHPRLRATVVSAGTLIQNLLGLAAGALIAGMVSDAFGLSAALALTPVFSLLACAIFLMASRRYVADLQAVEPVEIRMR